MSPRAYDRRTDWKPAPRPEWVARLNEEGEHLNIKSIVPLDEESLLTEARKNTGLDDFGNDRWLEHFRVLIRAIENEANLLLHPQVGGDITEAPGYFGLVRSFLAIRERFPAATTQLSLLPAPPRVERIVSNVGSVRPKSCCS